MARELGLGNEDTIKSLPTEHEQSDLRQTWWAVVTLDILSSFRTFTCAMLSDPVSCRWMHVGLTLTFYLDLNSDRQPCQHEPAGLYHICSFVIVVLFAIVSIDFSGRYRDTHIA